MKKGEKWPTGNGQPRPSCDWQGMTMKTDGLCSSYAAATNGDGTGNLDPSRLPT